MGLQLARLSRADDSRRVDPRGEAKRERRDDVRGRRRRPPAAAAILRSLSEKVSRRLKREGWPAALTLKLKTATEQDEKPPARRQTRLADRIFTEGQAAQPRADGTLLAGRHRHLGLQDPARADPADLIDCQATKRAAAEAAIDTIRGKFGNASVETGLVFDLAPRKPRRDQ
jgi:DNA polymerase-4